MVFFSAFQLRRTPGKVFYTLEIILSCHYFKRLNGWVSETEDWSWTLEGAKKGMIRFKNALIIVNHFKNNN